MKGISSLIAAVLLVAVVVALASLTGPFLTDVFKTSTGDTNKDLETVLDASDIELEVVDLNYDRKSEKLEVTVKKIGGPSIENLTTLLRGESYVQKVSTGENIVDGLNKINVSLSKTFKKKRIEVELEEYPVKTSKNIECLPENGLKGYWTLDSEHTDSNWTLDLTGNQNGSIESTSNEQGIIGESFSFPKADDQINVSDNPALDAAFSGEEISISFWMRPKKTESYSYSNAGVISREGSTDSGSFYFSEADTASPNFNFSLNLGSWETVGVDDYRFKSGEWYHVAGTYNSSKIGLYINSNLEDNRTVSGSITESNEILAIGGHPLRQGFNGSIDDVRIYNRSLSQEEVERLYRNRDSQKAVKGCWIK